MKIAVVNTKGGVGKTTTAIYLATVASAQGKSTELLDADPQGSATSWAEIATEGSAPLPFQVSPANKITLSRASSSD
ncbi:ParA family protein, partial [Dietzia sp. SLG510A3-3B2-2]|nr:ParA family protein [Dietzia sp. SLG510A3-40A3]MBB1010378.1 ParA family protein [Dietzia sp. SLG510A3-3B2-2]